MGYGYHYSHGDHGAWQAGEEFEISKSARQVSNLPFFHLTGEWQDPSAWNYGGWEEGGKVLFP